MARRNHSSYSKQIILYVGDSDQANYLADRWDRAHPKNPCITIEIDPTLEPKDPYYADLAELDANSRVYILGHHGPGLDFLQGNRPEDTVTYKELANIFSHQVHPGNVIDMENDRQLSISITACFAAKDKDGGHEKSFAAKLHNEMRSKGFRTKINARSTMVTVEKEGSKKTSVVGHEITQYKREAKWQSTRFRVLEAYDKGEITLELKEDLRWLSSERRALDSMSVKKQPESKLSWTWDKNERRQIVRDAYSKQSIFSSKSESITYNIFRYFEGSSSPS